MAIEYVDVLTPPRFEASGEIKPIFQAVADGNWLGAINLWIVRPNARLIYQQRPSGGWAPHKLDGSAAGYYRSGESGLDGLREAQEELGLTFDRANVTRIGHRLNVGVDSLGRERRAVISIYMTYDETPLCDFVLDPVEVPAIFEIAANEVVAAFERPETTFEAQGVNSDGTRAARSVASADFSYMWDDYHLKIARLAKQYASGHRALQY